MSTVDPFEAAVIADQADTDAKVPESAPVVAKIKVKTADSNLELLAAAAKIENMTEALKVIVMELERSQTQAPMSRTKIALDVAKAALES